MWLFNSRPKQSQDSIQNPQTPASSFGVNAGNSGSLINMSQSGSHAHKTDLSALKRAVPEGYGGFHSNQLWKGAGLLVLGVLRFQGARVGVRHLHDRALRRLANASAEMIRGPPEPVKILSPKLQEQLSSIIAVTKIKEENERHLRILMQGPRRTGKAWTSKKLAKDLGKEYGFVPHEISAHENGVKALEQLFDFEGHSENDHLLFFEDADRFLKPKSSEHTSERLKAFQDAFLLKSRQHDNRVMVVLGTKSKHPFLPEDYHVDEVMEFQLPGLEERKRILELCLRNVVLRIIEDKKNFDARVLNDDALYLEMAKITDGLAAKDLWNFTAVVGVSALGNGVFRELAIKKCQDAMEQHHKRIQEMIEDKKQKSKSNSTGADESEDSEMENPRFLPVLNLRDV